ncbi:Protein kinase domain-containing protein [Plasmodiophora brassicae]
MDLGRRVLLLSSAALCSLLWLTSGSPSLQALHIARPSLRIVAPVSNYKPESCGGDSPWEYYRCGDLIGVGGFSNVFRAEHRRTKRQVAVKVMNATIKTKRIFANEIDALRRIRDRHDVLKLHDAFANRRHMYIVTELLSGADLFEATAGGAVSDDDLPSTFRMMVDAVAYLHDIGICHLDIKLENFMFTHPAGVPGRTLKLIDFGLAMPVQDRAKYAPLMFGTEGYFAPERRYTCTGAQLKASDVWALGICLYLMATAGAMPVPTSSRSVGIRVNPAERPTLYNILVGLLELDTRRRLTCREALTNDYLR